MPDSKPLKLSAKSKREMNKLAEYIRAHPERKVDMESWFAEVSWIDIAHGLINHCGTVCCAGGHYVAKNFKKYQKYVEKSSMGITTMPGEWAARQIGLNEEQQNALFTPYGYDEDDLMYEEGFKPLSRATQKRRLLAVLDGKKPLTQFWLHPEMRAIRKRIDEMEQEAVGEHDRDYF